MLLEDLRIEIERAGKKLEEIRVSLDVSAKELEIQRLEQEMMAPGFWDDPDSAQKVSQQVTILKDTVGEYTKLQEQLADTEILWQLGTEEQDESVYADVERSLQEINAQMEHLELTLMLSGEYDKNNAIVTLHAGAGGTEAQDWASMLLRMYGRWAEKNGFRIETMDFLAGDEAGVKSATLMIQGVNAYGYLKAEKGVHRLVRISPFDASARRHTSFAALDVMPEIDDSVEIDINPVDLRVDTYRASGAGGQHINKTDSAVRMTHIPTGVVVQCQSERSQIQNREQCMRLLRARLFELEQQKQQELKNEIGGEYQAIEWGSQIRSYVFHPYNLVKDHRTGAETGNVQSVMDGEINAFIEAYLKKQVAKE
ncbi:MAG: peptide chain release factor 2 [Sporomusaceae bacterium]|nr:peptide chain release factor 2 [Sporomusaceae bacterium]